MDDKKQIVLDELGVAEGDDTDLSIFLEDGALINMTIKRWRGKVKITGDELGLREKDDTSYQNFMKEFISLGQKKIFPPSVLEGISALEVMGRKNLMANSFECPWGGRFIPLTAVDEFKKEDEKLSKEFFEWRDIIVENYADYISEVKESYLPLAGTVYKRLNNISINEQTLVPNEWLDDFISAIILQIPTKEDIADSFIWDIVLAAMPEGTVQLIRNMIDIQNGETPVIPEIRVVSRENSAGPLSSPLSDKQRLEKVSALQDDIAKNTVGENQEKFIEFIRSVLVELRQKSLEGADIALDSIEKNDGKLVGRASMGLRNVLNQVRLLNYYGDKNLQERIEKIEKELSIAPKKRDLGELADTILELRDYSAVSLTKLGQPTSKRSLVNTPGTKLADIFEVKEDNTSAGRSLLPEKDKDKVADSISVDSGTKNGIKNTRKLPKAKDNK